ncbi:hypothetical protein FMM05_02600 [Flavobacterium zepuense]|uniref:Uncharacterized protein n=1 Tax=Flavobacterium zepuense TaxID=2593302 RepID=A0A552VAN8_9FLAO|nr:hypothetical protein [Flavobacterium zepuense]TRW27548.1 hypothetical protein FMM05_02600 [Flavobacterium zepuense]
MTIISCCIIKLFITQQEINANYTSWAKAVSNEIIPKKYLIKNSLGNFIKDVDVFVKMDNSICIYKCPNDIFVVIEKDDSFIKKGVIFYQNIYIMEGNKVSMTAYPCSYNYKIMVENNQISINLNYIYRTKFSVKLSYQNHKIILVNQKGAFTH